MNRFTTPLAAALFTLLLAPAAQAADMSMTKTRDQVRAELVEAQRLGLLASVDHSGMSLRDLQPQRFPAMAPSKGKSVEQAKAELAEAVRSGELLTNDESGRKLNEAFPGRYTSAQVHTMTASR